MRTRSSSKVFLLAAVLGIGGLGCQLSTNANGESTGGAKTGGGETASGGNTSTGGNSGTCTPPTSGNSASSDKLPCDVYAADGGPCVAAHSTIRALLAAYNGPLYQVRKGTETKDILPLSPGGFANAKTQDEFCGDDVCTISIIYDQSGKGNHLTKAPPGGAKKTEGKEANAKALPIKIGGFDVYGEHNAPGIGYRNNKPNGTATGDNPQTVYMIVNGGYYNGGCCFDYGNAETNSMDNGEGTMEAVYFGTCTIWGKGQGSGPWIMGDLENGLWAGNTSPYECNTPVTHKFVVGMVKGGNAGANKWTIKVGNGQSGTLSKVFDGPRPNSRYNPMRKEGAVILGTGGDNSNAGQGDFFEGLMTAHYSSDAADDAVQANIVSVYGK